MFVGLEYNKGIPVYTIICSLEYSGWYQNIVKYLRYNMFVNISILSPTCESIMISSLEVLEKEDKGETDKLSLFINTPTLSIQERKDIIKDKRLHFTFRLYGEDKKEIDRISFFIVKDSGYIECIDL